MFFSIFKVSDGPKTFIAFTSLQSMQSLIFSSLSSMNKIDSQDRTQEIRLDSQTISCLRNQIIFISVPVCVSLSLTFLH